MFYKTRYPKKLNTDISKGTETRETTEFDGGFVVYVDMLDSGQKQ